MKNTREKLGIVIVVLLIKLKNIHELGVAIYALKELKSQNNKLIKMLEEYRCGEIKHSKVTTFQL